MSKKNQKTLLKSRGGIVPIMARRIWDLGSRELIQRVRRHLGSLWSVHGGAVKSSSDKSETLSFLNQPHSSSQAQAAAQEKPQSQ